MENTLALDAKTCAWFERQVAQMRAMESAMNGALSLVIEQHGLTGRWQLDLPNKQLVRTDVELKAA
jgi:hypothetical protein